MRLLDNVVPRRSPPCSIKMDDAGASHLNYARKDTMRLTPIAPLSLPGSAMTRVSCYSSRVALYATVLDSIQSK
jgi:hypothetical protein